MDEQENTRSDRMESRGLVVRMLFGFALVCSANLICFFPQTLIQVPPEAYRAYNLMAALSIVAGSLLCALLSISGIRKPERILLVLGYGSLAGGLACSYFVGDGSNLALVALAAVPCGLGIGLLMVCWFGFLGFVPERYAMLLQGGQALLGSLLFVAMWQTVPAYASSAALICLLVSAVLSVSVYRSGAARSDAYASQTALKEGLQIFTGRGNLGGSFVVSFLALVVVSLLYGIITAVIMAPGSDSRALDQATWGGIVGAGVFLLWAFFSKKRQYDLVLKVFFGILAFVLVLPVEGHGVVTAFGYQLVCLLFFSLVIDTFSSNRRVLLLVLSLSYAITRGVFLLGLYVPGQFGVRSYADLFNTASLLFFLVYVVFIALLLIVNWSRRQPQKNSRSSDQDLPRGDAQKRGRNEASADDARQAMRPAGMDGAALPQAEALRGAVGEGIVVASASLAQKNGLTKRETEVLAYLARGRDVAFICGELYLTRNTVKSYAKAIYAKLGVHSQQELIDAVDREAEALRKRSSL